MKSNVDRFKFKCQRCGYCCSDRPTFSILSNSSKTPYTYPKEMARMAAYLSITRSEFWKKYITLEYYPNDEFGRRTRLRSNGEHCMLMKKGYESSCTVHDIKPFSCRLHPLSINSPTFDESVNIRERLKRVSDFDDLDLTVIPHCKGFNAINEYTVAQWVEMNNLRELWKEIVDYSFQLLTLKEKIPDDEQLKKVIEDLFVK